MPRRVSLPGASELFRPTTAPEADDGSAAGTARPAPSDHPGPSKARGTGRVRHEEKITVYVTADELLALEQARLELRAGHDLAVDRGRIVREAIAVVLADLRTRGGDSELVRRLTGP